MESQPSRKIERPKQNRFGLQIHAFVLKRHLAPQPISRQCFVNVITINPLSTTLFTPNKTLSLYFPTQNVAKTLGI